MEAILPVFANIFQEQIAECDVSETIGNRATSGCRHSLFVYLIAARMRQRHHPQRQASSLRLCQHPAAADAVHRHTVRLLVHRRQQPSDLAVLLAEDVQRPGTVFTAAPGQQNLHRALCKRSTMTSTPSATRGPGITVLPSTTRCTRLLRTA